MADTLGVGRTGASTRDRSLTLLNVFLFFLRILSSR